jgi:hypothetical protein
MSDPLIYAAEQPIDSLAHLRRRRAGTIGGIARPPLRNRRSL